MRWLLLVPVAALAACSAPSARPANRWADERLWPVLEAQEHRDAARLCVLLRDTSAHVREAAALAFASVQSPAGIPCLTEALTDPRPAVRATAAFALGFVADSAALEPMADAAAAERDTSVQRALLSASFLAMQRLGRLTDPNAALFYLRSSHGHERARAADALRRLPDSLVQLAAQEIAALMAEEDAEVRPFLILAMRKLGSAARTNELQRIASSGAGFGERVNALRVYGKLVEGEEGERFLWSAVRDEAAGHAALAALADRAHVDGRTSLRHARECPDTLMRIGMLALALKQGDERVSDSARVLLRSMTPSNPFHRAEVLKALAVAGDDAYQQELLSTLRSDAHAMVRQAAFHGLVAMHRAIMTRSRYASLQDQYRQLGSVIQSAIATSDAGLICAAAELLQEEDAGAIRILLPAAMEQRAFASLEPIRDLEARLLLQQAIAKRDGLPPPAHAPPVFNHPINKEKLRALKQGQRYRIVTRKGEIIIATDVNECPGSSLAFDSLVTAGYYDGRYFHRVVPNFVIQGGCPRGDGYGGMPWTLRTEVGRAPFTAGAVGLASAGRDTESCQFFIAHSAAPHLDGRYTRFGAVVQGMEVVWRIAPGDRMLRVERAD